MWTWCYGADLVGPQSRDWTTRSEWRQSLLNNKAETSRPCWQELADWNTPRDGTDTEPQERGARNTGGLGNTEGKHRLVTLNKKTRAPRDTEQTHYWTRQNHLAAQWSQDQPFIEGLMKWVRAGEPCLLQRRSQPHPLPHTWPAGEEQKRGGGGEQWIQPNQNKHKIITHRCTTEVFYSDIFKTFTSQDFEGTASQIMMFNMSLTTVDQSNPILERFCTDTYLTLPPVILS